MNIESLTQIAEIMNSMGDKGLVAFITYVGLDFLKAAMAWVISGVVLVKVAGRIGGAIQAGFKAAH